METFKPISKSISDSSICSLIDSNLHAVYIYIYIYIYIQCSLTAEGRYCRTELHSLARSDGKRPDGVTMLPWKSGRPLVWDATCSDT